MFAMKPIAVLLLIASISLISCSDDPPSGNNDPNDTTDMNDTIADGVSMKVNGTSWSGITTSYTDPLFPGTAVLKEITSWKGDLNNSESITIRLVSLEPGTYQLSNSGTDMSINFVADENPGSGFLGDPVDVSSGSLEIVENSQERIAGRFSFSGTSQGGTTYTVSDGTFGVNK